jgi:hypothetical protein
VSRFDREPNTKEISMPPAKSSTSRSLHPGTFKEPAALKWLSHSLDAAQQALVELRADAGRDLSHGARDLHKDLRTFISNARRDSEKLAKALQRDFEHAQKQLAQDTGTAGEARAKTPAEPGSRPGPAKTKRPTTRRASTARAGRSRPATTANAGPGSRTAATQTVASTAQARASSGAREVRTGTRRDQLFALIVDQPGITLAQAAAQFGLKDATGLYAAARRLQSDGLVRKNGFELRPTAKPQP